MVSAEDKQLAEGRLDSTLNGMIVAGNVAREQFNEKLAEDPINAVEWCDGYLVGILLGRWASRIMKGHNMRLQKGEHCDLSQVAHWQCSELQQDMLTGASSMFCQSTSPYHRAVASSRYEAARRFLGRIWMWCNEVDPLDGAPDPLFSL